MILLLPLLLLVRSCGEKQSLSPADYVRWVEDESNGLQVRKRIGAYEYTLQFRPHDYVALKDHGPAGLSPALMEEEKTAMADMQYFTLRIAAEDHADDLLKYDTGDDQDYFSRLEYFSAAMQNDLSLAEGKDTLPCLLFHYERTYGIDPHSTFLLAFPKSKYAASDKRLIWNDRVLGSGPVHLLIKAENLNRIPHLTLQ